MNELLTKLSSYNLFNYFLAAYGGYDIITTTIAPSWAPYGNIADRQVRFAMKLSF